MPIQIVGKNLKNARIKAGMSQAELAQKVGTSASQIGKYERAQQDMTLTRVWELEKALNLQHGELVRGFEVLDKKERYERLAENIYKAVRDFENSEKGG